jgi:hypothetical protein
MRTFAGQPILAEAVFQGASRVSTFSGEKSAGRPRIGGADRFLCQACVRRCRPYLKSRSGWSAKFGCGGNYRRRELGRRSAIAALLALKRAPGSRLPIDRRLTIRPTRAPAAPTYRTYVLLNRYAGSVLDQRSLAGETACPTESRSTFRTAGKLETPAASFEAAAGWSKP